MDGSKGRILGYARVSSREQNLDIQLMALEKYVPEEERRTCLVCVFFSFRRS